MSNNESYPKGCSLSAFVKAKRREQGKASLRLDKVNQVLDLFSACVGPVSIDRSIYADS